MSAEEAPSPGQPAPPAPASPPLATARKSGLGRIVLAAVAAVVLLIVGIPEILHSLRTVSTDDAYVNSYVTFVAPRVSGQVASVLVDDNNRVKKGDVLVQLDPEPYQVEVAIKQAAVDAAQAKLTVAQAETRATLGQMRALRFKLNHAIEDVNNQVALVRSQAAKFQQSQASLTLAQEEFDRAKSLLDSKVVSKEEFDEKQAALDVAKAEVTQALQDTYQARAALGLPVVPADPASLAVVPDDVAQNFSTVRQALENLVQTAAQVGVAESSFDLTPEQAIAEFYQRDPSGNLDVIYNQILKNAPGVKEAQTALEQAQRDLDEANLNLRYCTVVAEIDGVVSRRNVNPGNNVQAGQSLMVLRSLKDIWIDANFKETQLGKLRIGQHVDLKLDMYGHSKIFEGRISGFTIGTGSTLSLLPAQNATGNFVKVVQRLPVRIDVMNYDPDKDPLFVGLSVTPYVDITSTPTGPNAGQFLQTVLPEKATPSPAGQ